VRQGRYDGIVISPGPGRPADAGVSTEVVRRLGPLLPVLGVCLGHQCIAEAYGGRIVTAPAIRHGRQSLVHHIDAGVFRGIDAPLLVARYHSLVVEESSLPSAVEVTARTADGTVMGIRHREHPVEGVQFHPESVLTIRGRELLATFVARCAAGARV
jgi:anthranilate synthase/aminodeoxychorismate synthase-like glutamine amidotransferase